MKVAREEVWTLSDFEELEAERRIPGFGERGYFHLTSDSYPGGNYAISFAPWCVGDN